MVTNKDNLGSEGRAASSASGGSGLLVIHDPCPDEETWRQLEEGAWVVLSFSDKEWQESFLAQSRERHIQINEILQAADYIDQVSLIAREEYLRFVAEWPEKFRKNGKSFKQMFNHRGEIAHWWLSSASFKDNEISSTFECLCHMEVVRSILKSTGFLRCVMVASDQQLVLLVARCCAQLNIPFWAPRGVKKNRDMAFIRGLADRIRFALYLSLDIVFSRFVLPRSRENEGSRSTVFLTVYPSCLELGGDGPRESNYRELPQQFAARSQTDATFLAVHHRNTPAKWFKMMAQRKRLSPSSNPRVLFLDSFLHPSDMAVVLSSFLSFFRYFWMDLTYRGFRDSFVFDGVNVYELVGREFRRWFLGSQIPYHLVVARAVERAVRSEGIQTLICFLELYPLARAVYYGAKRGNPHTATVAYQHANINRMKLWYCYRSNELVASGANQSNFIATMPIPDRYIFQGRNGMNILQGSGYPSDRCILTGSARYDQLAATMAESHGAQKSRVGNPRRSSKTTLLVTPSMSAIDARALIDITAQACGNGSEYTVLVKPHPHRPINSYVETARERHQVQDMHVVHDDLHTLIREADVIITSYSTAGDEAIALGRPVICYTGVGPCMATFLDIAAAPLVHSADELRCSLGKMLHDEAYRRTYQDRWPELVEASFYSLDGRANERIVDALLSMKCQVD